MAFGRSPTAIERSVAISSSALVSASALRAALAARSAARTAPRASGRNALPAAVSRIPRGSRSISLPPSSASSARICCDSPGWETCSCSAARVYEPVSTTATQYCSWRRFS